MNSKPINDTRNSHGKEALKLDFELLSSSSCKEVDLTPKDYEPSELSYNDPLIEWDQKLRRLTSLE